MRSVIAIFLVFLLSGCATFNEQTKMNAADRPIVVMVGIDGLRWDALDRFPAPALNKIAEEGVRAEHMTPVMPSVTFTNFYSIATGLYADGTGVTSNMAYSKEFGELMDRDMHGESRWWGGEPIWVTAEKQGVKTATMFWLGSEAEIKGERPTHWLPYDHIKPEGERVDEVLEWLSLPESERPSLVTLYFHHVDYGPETEEEGNAIALVDTQIANLRAGIEKLGLSDRVNLIVVADHGMSRVVPGNVVYLDDYIDFDDVFIPLFDSDLGASMDTFAHIYVDGGNVDEIIADLEDAHPNMQAYKRKDIPKNWHLNNADRTGDIFVAVDPGWLVFGRELTSRYKYPAKGMHGYDRFEKEMQASFLAMGPNFKSGVKAGPIENVEVYGMIAKILGLKPAKTDGNIKRVEYFMQP